VTPLNINNNRTDLRKLAERPGRRAAVEPESRDRVAPDRRAHIEAARAAQAWSIRFGVLEPGRPATRRARSTPEPDAALVVFPVKPGVSMSASLVVGGGRKRHGP